VRFPAAQRTVVDGQDLPLFPGVFAIFGHGNVGSLDELGDAFERAREGDRTAVLAIETAPAAWTPGGAFREVGMPEVSPHVEVAEARSRLHEGKARQRVGW
jgi:TPP-dependent trihydroxycyclohexane-1,2-dione (THcHDO) dehydratase